MTPAFAFMFIIISFIGTLVGIVASIGALAELHLLKLIGEALFP